MTILDKILKGKPKTPQEAVEACKDVLVRVKAGDPITEKFITEMTKAFNSVKWLLFGDDKHEPVQDDAYQVARFSCRVSLLPLLVENLKVLPFESRKDLASIFGSIVRIHLADDSCPGADVLLSRGDELLGFLVDGYGDPAVALICGQMLRDAVKEPRIAWAMLDSPVFTRIFRHLDAENFEIASDAFSTLRDVLTRHVGDEEAPVPRYLERHYDSFVLNMHRVIDSGNYVTKRQCLKLLAEMLATKANRAFTALYVADERNLMMSMQKLRDESRGIQFEAFHVFKVFVAHPGRGKTATALLTGNKDKLVKFLSEFHTDKDGQDEVFANDRNNVINMIAGLELGSKNGKISRDPSRKQLAQQGGAAHGLGGSAAHLPDSVVGGAGPRHPSEGGTHLPPPGAGSTMPAPEARRSADGAAAPSESFSRLSTRDPSTSGPAGGDQPPVASPLSAAPRAAPRVFPGDDSEPKLTFGAEAGASRISEGDLPSY